MQYYENTSYTVHPQRDLLYIISTGNIVTRCNLNKYSTNQLLFAFWMHLFSLNTIDVLMLLTHGCQALMTFAKVVFG